MLWKLSVIATNQEIDSMSLIPAVFPYKLRTGIWLYINYQLDALIIIYP